MPSYLITYDLKSALPDPHKPFLTAAEPEGLLYVWQGAQLVDRLPNTTIWGVFTSCSEALAAFDRAVAQTAKITGHPVTVEKRVSTRFTDGKVLSDRRKMPEPKWTKAGDRFATSRLHQLNDPYFR